MSSVSECWMVYHVILPKTKEMFDIVPIYLEIKALTCSFLWVLHCCRSGYNNTVCSLFWELVRRQNVKDGFLNGNNVSALQQKWTETRQTEFRHKIAATTSSKEARLHGFRFQIVTLSILKYLFSALTGKESDSRLKRGGLFTTVLLQVCASLQRGRLHILRSEVERNFISTLTSDPSDVLCLSRHTINESSLIINGRLCFNGRLSLTPSRVTRKKRYQNGIFFLFITQEFIETTG